MVAERTELAVVDGAAREYSSQELDLLRKTVANGTTPLEFDLFMAVVNRTGLDPFMRQIYAIKRGKGDDAKLTIQTGIDGYRLLAERTERYAGSDEPVYDTEAESHPNKATVTVWKLVGGQRVPFTASARWSEYCQRTRDGSPSDMWARMPYNMLAKCAEALALRKAFPADLSGIYTRDEMEQADNSAPLSYVEQAAAPTAAPTAAPAHASASSSAKQTLGQKLDQALKNSAITDLLQQLGQTTENEQRAHLMATFNTLRAGGQDVTGTSVLAHLRSQIETAQAAFPLETLETLETGASGN